MGIDKIACKVIAGAARGAFAKGTPEFAKYADKISPEMLRELAQAKKVTITKGLGKTLEPLEYKYKSTAEKVFESIQKMQGTDGHLALSGWQLKLLPKHVQDMLAPLLEGAKNPVARISYKAKPNYNVAGIKVTDGDRVVGTAAASITKPGSADAVIKARLNIPNKVQGNGFVDGSRPMDSYDVSSSIVRKKGKIKAEFQTGGAGFRVDGDENQIQRLLMPMGEGEYGFRAGYSRTTHEIQRDFDDVGAKIRYFLRGEKSV